MTRSLKVLAPLLAVGSILALLNAVPPGPLDSARSQDRLSTLFRHCAAPPDMMADPTPTGVGCAVGDLAPSGPTRLVSAR